DTVLFDGFRDLGNRNGAFVGQAAQGSQHHEMTVNFEVFPQLVTEVGATVAVGAQYAIAAPIRNEGTNLIRIGLDVVSGRNDRTGRLFQHLRDIRHVRRLAFRVPQVVAFAIQAVAAQLGEAGGAPDVRRNAPVLLQQFLRGNHFAQDGAGTEQLHAQLALAAFLQTVQATDDAFLVAFTHTGMSVVFVHHGDVVVHVLLVLNHPLQAVVNDH